MIDSVREVAAKLQKRFKVQLAWEREWKLLTITEKLTKEFPSVDFCTPLPRSSMRPDGGVLSLRDHEGNDFVILISERKNQGTNDKRATEGKLKQAKGNAVERLGKNVIGLKAAMTGVGIFPFVCFGDGCDFEDSSSILDRVVTIAMFGHLRRTYLLPLGPQGEFLRGSYYFREKVWSRDEILTVLTDIATRSIQFYFAKYGEDQFVAR